MAWLSQRTQFKLDKGHMACRTQLPLPGSVAVVFAVIVFIVVVLFVVVLVIVVLVIAVLVVVVLVVIFLVVICLVIFISNYYEWLADPNRHPDVL